MNNEEKIAYAFFGLFVAVATKKIHEANRRAKKSEKYAKLIKAQRDALADYAFGTDNKQARYEKLETDLKFIGIIARMK